MLENLELLKREKNKEKAEIYDIENFTVSYSKNETFIRNINTEFNRTVNYRGSVTYNYNTQPKNIKPFSKFNLGTSPYMRFIKDFNFNNMPKSFSYRTEIDRNYNEVKLRNINNSNMIIFPTYNKFFKWNKMYEFKYDITRTLKLDFAANSKANIDEPFGRLDRSDPEYKQKMDTIWNNFWNSGRPTSYHQTVSLNYQVPLNKLPIFNFMSLSTRYNGNYNWNAAPLSLENLGNTIQNSQSRQYNGQINLTTLYNKVPYFKKLNKGNSNRGRPTRNRVKEENEEEKQDRFEFFKHMTRFALGVKNISISYSENRGTLLPGFVPQPSFLGQQWSSMAPSIPFVLGSQREIRNIAASNGWITQDSSLNTQFKQNSSTNLTLRSTVEPIKQFRIELNASKNTSSNNQEYFRWDNIQNGFNSFSPNRNR